MIREMSHKLPDGGAELRRRRAMILNRIQEMKKPPVINLSEIGQGGVVKQKGLVFQARLLTSGAVEQLHA